MNYACVSSDPDVTDLALLERSRGNSSDPVPDNVIPKGRLLNLARPWRFPAGHPDLLHCRRHARMSVKVPVELALYRPDGTFFDRGTGIILDLSFSGARLFEVSLTQGKLLATYLIAGVRPALESPKSPEIAARILRTFSPGMPGFGIEFLSPSSGAAERIRQLADSAGS